MSFRWGIIGLGGIAGQFARGLKSVPDAELVAVGSRTQDKADKFAEEHDSKRSYASYEAVANDPDVDAVYIASPHSEHAAGAKLCIEHGKAVLLEKPFTINALEAKSIVDLARQHNVFLMEAMWTRFFPAMVTVRKTIADGLIGEVKLVQADFGFHAGFDPESRLFNPKLGGGALLDVGVYAISLASMVLGKPDRITGFAVLGETKVDEIATISLGYPGGKLSSLTTAVRLNTPHVAYILGESGSIYIGNPWWQPSSITIRANGHPEEKIDFERIGNGYNYQAVEVAQCVQTGKLESDIMPLHETLSIMETMDELRKQWGVKYPME